MMGRKTKWENMEHTKGPWKCALAVVENSPSVWVVTESSWGSENIAVSTNEANARLISAAPDLLEACKRIRDNAMADDPNDWKMLDAAIAKAEGRA
jgi:hypothetical protein